MGHEGVGRESVAAMVAVSGTSGPRGANLRLLKFAEVGFCSALGSRGVEFIPQSQIGEGFRIVGAARRVSLKISQAGFVFVTEV